MNSILTTAAAKAAAGRVLTADDGITIPPVPTNAYLADRLAVGAQVVADAQGKAIHAPAMPLHHGLIREDMVVGCPGYPPLQLTPIAAARADLATARGYQRQSHRVLAEARRCHDNPPRYTNEDAAQQAQQERARALRQAESVAAANDEWVARAEKTLDGLTVPALAAE